MEFIPYALYCIKCQNNINDRKPFGHKDRPNEEKIMKNSFGYGINEFKESVGFDIEDSYQAVARYERRRRISEYYDESEADDEMYTDPIERISNQQYKNQLPD